MDKKNSMRKDGCNRKDASEREVSDHSVLTSYSQSSQDTIKDNAVEASINIKKPLPEMMTGDYTMGKGMSELTEVKVFATEDGKRFVYVEDWLKQAKIVSKLEAENAKLKEDMERKIKKKDKYALECDKLRIENTRIQNELTETKGIIDRDILFQKGKQISDKYWKEKVNGKREALANLEHEQWSHIIKFLSRLPPDELRKKVYIDYKDLKLTKYEHLSENDKNKDRVWADRVIKIILS